MSRPHIRSSALVRLLDAMEADLFAATTEELRGALRETGRGSAGACQEIGAVLEVAMQQEEDGAATPALHHLPIGAPLYRH